MAKTYNIWAMLISLGQPLYNLDDAYNICPTLISFGQTYNILAMLISFGQPLYNLGDGYTICSTLVTFSEDL